NAGELLTDAAPHKPRLARVQLEAFFQGDASDVNLKPARAAFQTFAARECQVVRIARVACLYSLGQPGQAAIQPIGAEVGQGRGSWGALRQMPTAIMDAVYFARSRAQHILRHGGRTQSRQKPCDLRWIPEPPEHGVNARSPHGGKELAEVKADHDALPDVRLDIAPNRMPAPETVSGGMRRHQA